MQTPESFKVLIKELQALCLDVKVLNEDNEEVKLKEFSDDDSEDLDVNIEGTEELVTEPVAGDDSYTTNDEEMDEDIDYESFALEGFHEEELELDDFVNDEH